MRLLITGGAGFIGVNAVERFLRKGDAVTIFDNFSRRGTDINLRYLEQAFPKHLTVIRGDIRSADALTGAFASAPDAVLHLAGQVAVTTSVANPREDFEVNALGTFNVLEAARACKKPPMVLFASTNKVYGGLEDLPVAEGEKRYAFENGVRGVSETQPLDFHSPYGCSKGAADQYVRDYGRIYGLRTVVFRQSCIYGPRQMGMEDQGWVAWFMIAAMFKRPFSIYGNGKQVRDLLYVDDLIDVYESAIARPGATAGQVYNIGGGQANTLSLLEFLRMLESDLALPIQYSYAKVRPGDQPIFVSDNAKAERELGWKPTTAVRDGVPRLLAWLQGHRDELQSLYR